MIDLAKVKEAYLRYIDLSMFLFGMGDAAVYDVNEIPKNHRFYNLARSLAASMEIDWEGMAHEESNRIMLAMLDDTYNAIAKAVPKKDKNNLIIDAHFKVVKNKNSKNQ